MRVTQEELFRPVLSGIKEGLSQMNELRKAIASGKRVQTPSDDTLAARRIMSSNDKEKGMEQFLANIKDGRTLIDSEMSVLGNLQDNLSRAKELMIRGSSDTLGPLEKNAIAKEIDAILVNILQDANTQQLGKFIFSGGKTQTKPFVETLTGGKITAVTYNGDRKEIKYQISEGINLGVNKSGAEIYDNNAIFSTLIKVRDDLEANNTSAVNASLTTLDSITQQVFKEISSFGSKLKNLDLTEKRLEDAKIRLNESRSIDEDADLAELITKLQTQEMVFQTALASGARITKVSLLNFI